MAGTYPSTLTLELNRLANGGAYPALGATLMTAQQAANVWAGTSGLDMIHALNLKAGFTDPANQFRDINKICAILAGRSDVPEATTSLIAISGGTQVAAGMSSETDSGLLVNWTKPDKKSSFEAQTSGTTVTAANSGGGSDTAFDVVQAPAGTSVLQYDNTHAKNGTNALKVSTTTSDSTYVQWNNLTRNVCYPRIYMWWDAFPTNAVVVWRGLDSGNLTKVYFKINSTTGKIQWFDSANATIGLASTNAIPTGQWFRIEATCTAGTSGSVVADLFFGADPDSTTPTETMTLNSVNLSSTEFSRYRAGVVTSTANIGPFWIDAYRMSVNARPGPGF